MLVGLRSAAVPLLLRRAAAPAVVVAADARGRTIQAAAAAAAAAGLIIRRRHKGTTAEAREALAAAAPAARAADHVGSRGDPGPVPSRPTTKRDGEQKVERRVANPLHLPSWWQDETRPFARPLRFSRDEVDVAGMLPGQRDLWSRVLPLVDAGKPEEAFEVLQAFVYGSSDEYPPRDLFRVLVCETHKQQGDLFLSIWSMYTSLYTTPEPLDYLMLVTMLDAPFVESVLAKAQALGHALHTQVFYEAFKKVDDADAAESLLAYLLRDQSVLPDELTLIEFLKNPALRRSPWVLNGADVIYRYLDILRRRRQDLPSAADGLVNERLQLLDVLVCTYLSGHDMLLIRGYKADKSVRAYSRLAAMDPSPDVLDTAAYTLLTSLHLNHRLHGVTVVVKATDTYDHLSERTIRTAFDVICHEMRRRVLDIYDVWEPLLTYLLHEPAPPTAPRSFSPDTWTAAADVIDTAFTKSISPICKHASAFTYLEQLQKCMTQRSVYVSYRIRELTAAALARWNPARPQDRADRAFALLASKRYNTPSIQFNLLRSAMIETTTLSDSALSLENDDDDDDDDDDDSNNKDDIAAESRAPAQGRRDSRDDDSLTSLLPHSLDPRFEPLLSTVLASLDQYEPLHVMGMLARLRRTSLLVKCWSDVREKEPSEYDRAFLRLAVHTCTEPADALRVLRLFVLRTTQEDRPLSPTAVASLLTLATAAGDSALVEAVAWAAEKRTSPTLALLGRLFPDKLTDEGRATLPAKCEPSGAVPLPPAPLAAYIKGCEPAHIARQFAHLQRPPLEGDNVSIGVLQTAFQRLQAAGLQADADEIDALAGSIAERADAAVASIEQAVLAQLDKGNLLDAAKLFVRLANQDHGLHVSQTSHAIERAAQALADKLRAAHDGVPSNYRAQAAALRLLKHGYESKQNVASWAPSLKRFVETRGIVGELVSLTNLLKYRERKRERDHEQQRKGAVVNPFNNRHKK